jgi:hypothetical protein
VRPGLPIILETPSRGIERFDGFLSIYRGNAQCGYESLGDGERGASPIKQTTRWNLVGVSILVLPDQKEAVKGSVSSDNLGQRLCAFRRRRRLWLVERSLHGVGIGRSLEQSFDLIGVSVITVCRGKLSKFGVDRSPEQSFKLVEVRGEFREILSLIKVVWLAFRQ